MRIWPRDFWWNPHLFCLLSTSTFGTAWRAPAHATLERKAATSCFQRSMPPSWISNAWHPTHMSNPVSNAKGKKCRPPRRVTSGFMLKPAIIHKQDVPLLLYGETINAKRLFSILILFVWSFSPSFWAFSHSSSWMTSESFCSWGMCSEIPSFGTSEVWRAYVWSLRQMLARHNSLSLLITSSSHLLSTVTSSELDVARD